MNRGTERHLSSKTDTIRPCLSRMTMHLQASRDRATLQAVTDDDSGMEYNTLMFDPL